MEYGRTEPPFRHVAGGVVARGGPAQLTLMSPVPLLCKDGAARARIVVGEGDVVEFRATYQPSFGAAPADGPDDTATIEDTLELGGRCRSCIGATRDGSPTRYAAALSCCRG